MLTNNLTLDDLRLHAHDYRVKRGYEHGWVMFYEGAISGWCSDNRFAESDYVKTWVAGVIAIDAKGHALVACGGNYQDGATHWETLNAQ